MTEIKEDVFITPIRTMRFKDYDKALDFIRFVRPESLAIDTVYQVENGNKNIIAYQVKYSGSEGMMS